MVHVGMKRGLVAGVLGLGLMMSGSSVASAAPSSLVLSDVIQFAGVVSPGPTGGSFTFKSTSCRLRSDTDAVPVYKCQLNSMFTLSSTGTGNGTAVVTSLDGTTKWSFALAPGTAANSFVMKGKGAESDNPENGVPSTTYPCVVRGTLQATGATTASGTVRVLEKAGQP